VLRANVALTAAVAISALCTAVMAIAEPRPEASQTRGAIRFSTEGTMPSLNRATQWLNSEPLTPVELRGKVVLIDFWTYTCINWLRTTPYVRAWHEKYKDQGLVVIGVHSPEFAFETIALRRPLPIQITSIS
jgi:thiol-disulfide isomerase/thioredoxin